MFLVTSDGFEGGHLEQYESENHGSYCWRILGAAHAVLDEFMHAANGSRTGCPFLIPPGIYQ
jgi:hypothetical protein